MERDDTRMSLDAASIPLAIGHYRADFQPIRAGRGNLAFPGSAWRGALGKALRDAVCVTGQPQCAGCPLLHRCLYPYFFETPPPPGATRMRKYPNAPHPFVLRPGPGELRAGEPVELAFTLVGRATHHLDIFSNALSRAAAGRRGIGGHRYQLNELKQCLDPGTPDWQTIATGGTRPRAIPARVPEPPPAPGSVLLHLQTPVRVKRQGRLLGPAEFGPGDLFANLLRRLSLLTYFHGETELERDFKSLNALAREIPAQGDLDWQEQTRYSARQRRKLKAGGVVGWMQLEHPDLETLWPYLWIGQWVHAGANATMGLGQYRLIETR